jgi:Tfp pilus assembly protein PilF
MMLRRHLKSFLAVAVSLLAFAVYLSALQNEFVHWDDDRYIFENLHIRSLDISFFKWAFFDFYAGNWHPLTWISHALDYAIWGLNPMGHHLTNNILHAVNTFLVVLLSVRILEIWKERTGGENARGMLIAGGVTGLLFGLHPLHVESVAWASERKDLLCALFFLLSIMAYTQYAIKTFVSFPLVGNPFRHSVIPTCSESLLKKDSGQARMTNGQAGMTKPQHFLNKQYLLSLGFFILALMSKPMAVTLPVVLFILDWHPFDRVRSFKEFRVSVVEKLPFIALGIVSTVVTVFAQRAGGTIRSLEFAPLSVRVLVGFKALIFYLWKMIWPLDLIPFYPYPKEASFFSLEYLSAIVVVLGITMTCIIMARKQKAWLSAWGYYVVTLLPVLGFVQVGKQAMADRYMYLPSLGPILLVGLFAAWVWVSAERLGKRGQTARVVALAVLVCVTASLSYISFRQIGIWRNSIVFWSYVIEKEPERVPVAYNNRGVAYNKLGMTDKAINDFSRSVALDPSEFKAFHNRGVLYRNMGLLDKAIGDFDKAIQINPEHGETYIRRGITYFLIGQKERALKDFDEAISLNKDNHEAYLNRGTFYFSIGNYELAASDFQKACYLGSREGCARSAMMTKGARPLL